MNKPGWSTTLALVKRIMDARTTKVARRTSRCGGNGVVVRPFRASQLAEELGEHKASLHGWLYYGVEPREETKAKIRKWCAKHKGVLK